MKKDKSYYGWFFTVVTLLILLGVSIYLGVSGWYFATDFSQSCDIELGNTVEVAIKKNQSSTCSFSFSGGILPNEKMAQIVNIRNREEDKPIYVRAKIYLFMKDSSLAEMGLVNNSNWFLNNDGYYYFSEKLIPKGKVGLCSHIVVSETAHLSGQKSYITTIAFESLDADLDPVTYWGIDPTIYNQEQPISDEIV